MGVYVHVAAQRSALGVVPQELPSLLRKGFLLTWSSPVSLGRLAVLPQVPLSLFSQHWGYRSTLLYLAFFYVEFGVRTQVSVFG